MSYFFKVTYIHKYITHNVMPYNFGLAFAVMTLTLFIEQKSNHIHQTKILYFCLNFYFLVIIKFHQSITN